MESDATSEGRQANDGDRRVTYEGVREVVGPLVSVAALAAHAGDARCELVLQLGAVPVGDVELDPLLDGVHNSARRGLASAEGANVCRCHIEKQTKRIAKVEKKLAHSAACGSHRNEAT